MALTFPAECQPALLCVQQRRLDIAWMLQSFTHAIPELSGRLHSVHATLIWRRRGACIGGKSFYPRPPFCRSIGYRPRFRSRRRRRSFASRIERIGPVESRLKIYSWQPLRSPALLPHGNLVLVSSHADARPPTLLIGCWVDSAIRSGLSAPPTSHRHPLMVFGADVGQAARLAWSRGGVLSQPCVRDPCMAMHYAGTRDPFLTPPSKLYVNLRSLFCPETSFLHPRTTPATTAGTARWIYFRILHGRAEEGV